MKGKVNMRKNEKLLRRVLALILCLVMAAMIAACGNTDPNVDLYDPDGTKPTENNTPTQPEDDDSVVIIPGNEGGSGSGSTEKEQEGYDGKAGRTLAGRAEGRLSFEHHHPQ